MFLGNALVALLATLALTCGAHAHSCMTDPPARRAASGVYSSMCSAQKYELSSGNCNGGGGVGCRASQLSVDASICGGPFQASSWNPRDLPWGQSGSKQYAPGSVINLSIYYRVSHTGGTTPGWVEARLCTDGGSLSQGCFDAHKLTAVGGSGLRHTVASSTPPWTTQTYAFQLPTGVECSQCVLQYIWQTSSWDGETGEQFQNCADISVGGSGSPPVETPAVEPPAVEPPTVEPPTVEPPVEAPTEPAVEPPVEPLVEAPAVEPPVEALAVPPVKPPAVVQPTTGQPVVDPNVAVERPTAQPPAEPTAAQPTVSEPATTQSFFKGQNPVAAQVPAVDMATPPEVPAAEPLVATPEPTTVSGPPMKPPSEPPVDIPHEFGILVEETDEEETTDEQETTPTTPPTTPPMEPPTTPPATPPAEPPSAAANQCDMATFCKQTGVHAAPCACDSNCNSFVNCNFGTGVLTKCHPLLRFNPAISNCDWPANVQCSCTASR